MDLIDIGFVNQIKTFWKMFKNIKFFETRFSQGKMVELGLFTVTMIYKMVLNGSHDI